MKINRELVISFLIGAVVASFFQWLLFFRKPFLFTDSAKGNYAYGQRIAQNLLKQKVEIQPRIIAAAMMDAENESSRLSKEEMQKGVEHIQNESIALRKKEEPPKPTPADVAKSPDAEGFRNHDRGFKYWLGDWKSYTVQFRRDMKGIRSASNSDTVMKEAIPPRPVDANSKLEFHLTIRDQDEKIIFDSRKNKKSFKFLPRELPPQLLTALTLISPPNPILIRLNPESGLKLPFAWPKPINEKMTVEIFRIN